LACKAEAPHRPHPRREVERLLLRLRIGGLAAAAGGGHEICSKWGSKALPMKRVRLA
jgi:hypothetical protein